MFSNCPDCIAGAATTKNSDSAAASSASDLCAVETIAGEFSHQRYKFIGSI